MDKLTIINRALVASGNQRVLVAEDGTDEWIAADTAFERAIDYLMGMHAWPFATKTLALTRNGDGYKLPWTDRWQYPTDCWHLRTVYDPDTGQPLNYTILKHEIHTRDIDAPEAIYVLRPDMGSTWHPSAFEVITLLVEAELWRGLNGDPSRGDATWTKAENMLIRAAVRADQQTSPRQSKSSRAGAARRTRRF